MKTPVLETNRLRLRAFTKDDVEAVYNGWQSDPDVSKYMMWESSNDIKETQKFIKFELGMIDSDIWYRWCIEDKISHEVYGTCLIYFDEDENNWDISYNLSKKYWGRGYITEAMKKAMDYAINTLSIKEFVTSHANENPASGKVIQKLGFKFEKDIPYICNGGKIHTTGKFYRLKLL